MPGRWVVVIEEFKLTDLDADAKFDNDEFEEVDIDDVLELRSEEVVFILAEELLGMGDLLELWSEVVVFNPEAVLIRPGSAELSDDNGEILLEDTEVLERVAGGDTLELPTAVDGAEDPL